MTEFRDDTDTLGVRTEKGGSRSPPPPGLERFRRGQTFSDGRHAPVFIVQAPTCEVLPPSRREISGLLSRRLDLGASSTRRRGLLPSREFVTTVDASGCPDPRQCKGVKPLDVLPPEGPSPSQDPDFLVATPRLVGQL